jgi:hypothetical protein
VRVIPTGPSQGRTVLDDVSGRPVEVFADVDLDGFYQFVLGRWQR